MKLFFTLLCILLAPLTGAMELPSEKKDLHATTRILIIPGMGGLGGQNIRGILPEFKRIWVQTPGKHTVDLGQDNCIQYLLKALEEAENDSNVENIFIHASSQATATTINCLKIKAFKKLKGVMLESVMASGNSAICHTIKRFSPTLAKIPFCYRWAPFLAKKLLFKSYKPHGEQPIFDLDKIPKNVPIIIFHSKDDIQTPFTDAEALGQGLIHHGHTKVYFLPQDSGGHLFILGDDTEKEITTLRAILTKHKLLVDPDLLKDKRYKKIARKARYKPKNFDQYESLLAKEKPSEKAHENVNDHCLSS